MVKAKEVKARDVKKALEEAGIEVTSVIEVFREEEPEEERQEGEAAPQKA
jgi:hypothetical protein